MIARFRPETAAEQAKGQRCLQTTNGTATVGTETFAFDRVFDGDASQRDVFQYSVPQTVEDLFNGYNGTVLAYGQTGSGKTYTMMGSDISDDQQRGVIPRIADLIFDRVADADAETECTLSASYVEIYMEQIRDLLTSNRDKKLVIHEDGLNGVHVRNLTKAYLGSKEDVYELLRKGAELRAVGKTDMNLESSRSHAILQIDLTQESLEYGIKRSKLFLVDLAGSEKVGKTGASGQTLEEAKKINSSLSALGNVISALTDAKSSHIPYRDSKLTRILQESLGGNSRTSLIINCSLSSSNEAETLSTLRFGSRAKKIKNKAHINAEPSQLDFVREIEYLKRVNEEKDLRLREIEMELSLWKTGVNKLDRAEPEPMSTSLSDDDSTLHSSENSRRGEYLENRVRELTPMVGMCPSLVSSAANAANDFPLAEQSKDSQTLNEALVNDLESKCLFIIELQTQIDKQVAEKKAPSIEEDQILALGQTLERFSLKINELEERNRLFAHEVRGLRSVAETRTERIKVLEKLVKSSRGAVQDESKSFEFKFFSLQDRLISARKLTHPPSGVITGDHITGYNIPGGGESGYSSGGHQSFYGLKEPADAVAALRRMDTGSLSMNSGSRKGPLPRVGLSLNVLRPVND